MLDVPCPSGGRSTASILCCSVLPFVSTFFRPTRESRRGWTVRGVAVDAERERTGTRYGCYQYTNKSESIGLFSRWIGQWRQRWPVACSTPLSGADWGWRVPCRAIPRQVLALVRRTRERGTVARSSTSTERARRRQSYVDRPVSCEVGDERLTVSRPARQRADRAVREGSSVVD